MIDQPDRALEPGTVVGGYRIESRVGRGGMGVVYRAWELELNRVVALKVIAPELVEDDAIRARFLREARAAAAIEHPHVIPIHAAGEGSGRAFIAMRFVDGRDLRAQVRRDGAQDPERAVALVEQAAAGLDAIHRGGFVHRDVKPANLLIDPSGHVYVTDFGLVKHALSQSGATSTGQWVGTLDYVSPEQIRGGRIDARTDVYALGGVLHFALTGHVPFEREGDEAKLWAQLSDPPPRPSTIRAGLPVAFDAVVARAMRKSPDQRFPSAGDLGRAARAALTGTIPSQPERTVARGAAAPGGAETEPGIAPESTTVSAARATALMPASRRRRRRWVLPAASLGLVAAGVTVFALLSGDPPARGGAAARVTPTATAKAAAGARIAGTIPGIGRRPSVIVYAAGDLWVATRAQTRLTRIDAATGRARAQHPLVGSGTVSMVAHDDTVWVALSRDRRVVALDARSGRKVREIKIDGKPTRMRVDRSGVWVLTGLVPGRGQRLLRFDLRGRPRGEFLLRHSHSAMALGAGSIWLAEVGRRRIVRVDPRTGERQGFAPLPGREVTLSYGGGYLWAVARDTDTITRINPRDPAGHTTLNAGHSPAQAVVAGDLLYVSAKDDNQVRVFDAESAKAVGEPVTVALNPAALATDGRSVWVTSLGEDTVTRLVPG